MENVYKIPEMEIIEEIRAGYIECRLFFHDHKGNTKKNKNLRTKFLVEICEKFLGKFKTYQNLFPISIDGLHRTIKKSQWIPIKFNNGGFEYPRSFSVYLDHISSQNNLFFSDLDLSDLDLFINNFPTSFNLNEFFKGFYRTLTRIEIPLRLREKNILKLLINPEFLRTDLDGSLRILPPNEKDIVNTLLKKDFSLKNARTSLKFLSRMKICNYTGIIMNMGKLGFNYLLTDISSLLEIGESENQPKNYSFWEINFPFFSSKIYCSPSFDRKNMSKNYIPLTNWLWNINLNQFDKDISNPWKNFRIPNLFLNISINSEFFVNWKLEAKSHLKFEPWQVPIIKSISRYNNYNLSSLEELSPEIDSNQLINFVKGLVKNRVFQFYPTLNFIGIENKIAIRYSTKNKNLFKNITSGLLMFPITHIFTNEEMGEAIGYIHIPKHTIGPFLSQIEELKYFNESLFFEYQLNRLKLTKRCLNLSNFILNDKKLLHIIENSDEFEYSRITSKKFHGNNNFSLKTNVLQVKNEVKQDLIELKLGQQKILDSLENHDRKAVNNMKELEIFLKEKLGSDFEKIKIFFDKYSKGKISKIDFSKKIIEILGGKFSGIFTILNKIL
ncbi:MAG: hypothetical protein HeimC3_53190 [Candidatus Heimdallarchaeota archaeon LC_3]|nr:MAG: hypothetical protein HeimC3_53190 [Candidatus Heimdallarchaeota archaeon LC_3]